MFLAILTVTVFFVIAAWRLYWRNQRSSLPLPPGPKGLPLIGNLFDMPKSHSGVIFHEWAEKYGSDILHVNAAGQSIIILDSYDVAIELLEKRSAVYSSRPYMAMFSDPKLIGAVDWNFSFMPYGDLWRSHRRLFHQIINENSTKLFRPFQQQNAYNLLVQLLEQPENFSSHIMHYVSSTVLYIAYGLHAKKEHDPYLELAEASSRGQVQAAVPGRYIVDAFPFLRHLPAWFPGATFKRDALAVRRAVDEATEVPFEVTKKMVEEGTAEPSFISLALNSAMDLPDQPERARLERNASQVASLMFQAGTDTTAALVAGAVYAFLLYPNVQKKAQAELDKLGTLPLIEHEESLPYITATMLEVLRWHPVAPIGVPHYIHEEDIFRGYRIPKDSMVIGNAWGMLYDEAKFPNPSVFDPERFLKNGVLNPDVPDPRKIIFGFGRRVCPGRQLGLTSAWIAIASILATFDVMPGSEETHPSKAFDEKAIIREVLPFKCVIRPRSRRAVDLIRGEF